MSLNNYFNKLKDYSEEYVQKIWDILRNNDFFVQKILDFTKFSLSKIFDILLSMILPEKGVKDSSIADSKDQKLAEDKEYMKQTQVDSDEVEESIVTSQEDKKPALESVQDNQDDEEQDQVDGDEVEESIVTSQEDKKPTLDDVQDSLEGNQSLVSISGDDQKTIVLEDGTLV